MKRKLKKIKEKIWNSNFVNFEDNNKGIFSVAPGFECN